MPDQRDDIPQTPLGSSSHHQDSLAKPNNRRSTLLVRSHNPTEPPTENKNNSDEVNNQLKHEYKSIQMLNKTLSSVLQDFESASQEIHQFSETLNRTDQLLSLWLSVLERTEETKRVLEDEHWLIPVSGHRGENGAKGNS